MPEVNLKNRQIYQRNRIYKEEQNGNLRTNKYKNLNKTF